MKFEYYYNNVPGKGLCRNNLIYTSLISTDKKTFCQWYFNDSEYHKGKNEVIDPALMENKWEREVSMLELVSQKAGSIIPEILDIDHKQKRIYLKIDGNDFWQLANCNSANYDKILPDWQDQMLDIIKTHYSLNIHKYSMHPSSYFLVQGKLKSINYFFAYSHSEPNISISDVESHIHTDRQKKLRQHLTSLGINWDTPQIWYKLDQLCWLSFRNNYPQNFIDLCLQEVKNYNAQF